MSCASVVILREFFYTVSFLYAVALCVFSFISAHRRHVLSVAKTRTSFMFILCVAISTLLALASVFLLRDRLVILGAFPLLAFCIIYNIFTLRGRNLASITAQVIYLIMFTLDAFWCHWIFSFVCLLILSYASLGLLKLFFGSVTWKMWLSHLAFVLVSAFVAVYVFGSYEGRLVDKNFGELKTIARSELGISSDPSLLKLPLVTDVFKSLISNRIPSEAFFLDLISKMYRAKDVYFISRDGRVTLSSTPFYLGKNYKNRHFFKEALSGKTSFFVARNSTGGDPYLLAAVPVWRGRKIIGVLAYRFSLDMFFPGTVWESGWLIMHRSGLVIHGPKELVGTCIECDKRLLEVAVKEHLLGGVSVKAGKQFVHQRGFICPVEYRDVNKCFLLVKMPFGSQFYIARVLELSDMMGIRLAILGVWAVIAFIGFFGSFEIHRWMVLTSTDPLTGLLNRRELFSKAQELMREAINRRLCVHFMLMDLDNFKSINDTYGHQAGDDVLIYVSKILRSHVKERDVVARAGGEEFVIVSLSDSIKDGHMIAERIREKVESVPVSTASGEVEVTISIGVVSLCFGKEDYEDLDLEIIAGRCFSLADERMYEAKRAGKNRTVVAELTSPWDLFT